VTDATRALVRVSAAIARSDRFAVESALAAAAHAAGPVQVEEALLQSHLFVGYPAMLQALAAWRGLVPVAPPDDADAADPAGWQARGERVCARVYGGQYERLRANVLALHPALDRWMVADGYGRVLGRPGLALDARELCVVALLCAQDAPAQLYAHLRGALQAGASAEDVDEAVRESTVGLSAERAEAARSTWDAVRARARPEESDG
jgi:4-carboxymuconolactone decarboxylase